MVPKEPHCLKSDCFFCAMNEANLATRRARLAKCFNQMSKCDDYEELVLTLSSIWNISMADPDEPEFPSLGIFKSMASLIDKGVSNRQWLLKGQNVYTPYYAAHIIGSYTMNKSLYAEKAVDSGVIRPLMELMRGKISWIEQRVAVRALGHLVTHTATLKAVAEHEVEIIKMAKEISSTCIDTVYNRFIILEHKKRLRYQCDLLTKGVGGAETTDRKAEEWASQLQCWALYIIHCFISQQRAIKQVCKDILFLNDLCKMWGGLANSTSPAGIGLIRSLCYRKLGRRKISASGNILITLHNVSRSSDDWQYMAIDCLILLLKDPVTRKVVFETTLPILADLVELEDVGKRSNFGEAITQAVLIDYHKFKYGDGLKLSSAEAKLALDDIWDQRVERRKKEKLMSSEEIEKRRTIVKSLKKQGNELFWGGEIEKAMLKYTEGLNECLVTKMRRQRMILYSNRAQCNLMMKRADEAISDATRALCLSEDKTGGALECKSLWRRAQAYEMKGLAKESLLDCLMFVNGRMRSDRDGGGVKVPYYAARMISKQMNATWLFASAKAKTMNNRFKEF